MHLIPLQYDVVSYRLCLVSAEFKFASREPDFGKILNGGRENLKYSQNSKQRRKKHAEELSRINQYNSRVISLFRAFKFYDQQRVMPPRFGSFIVNHTTCGIYLDNCLVEIYKYKTDYVLRVFRFHRLTWNDIHLIGIGQNYHLSDNFDDSVKIVIRLLCTFEFNIAEKSLNLKMHDALNNIDPDFAAKMSKMSDSERDAFAENVMLQDNEPVLRTGYFGNELRKIL